jgi:hypothetical protein
VTNRRRPAQRTTSSDWKPTRPKAELFKAIGGASAVVLLTVLAIFLMKPADTDATTPPPAITPNQPTEPTPTTPTQPGETTTTPPTAPAASTTTTQP